MNAWGTTKEFILDNDNLAPTINTELHINDNVASRTFLGGVLSLCLYAFVAYIAISNAVSMIKRSSPYQSSFELELQPDNAIFQETRSINQLNKILLRVYDYKGNHYSGDELDQYVEIIAENKEA